MIAPWLLFSTVTGLALTGAALAAERFAAAARLPRRFIWVTALAATALWPAVALVQAWTGLAAAASTDGAASIAIGVRRLSALVIPEADAQAARRLDITLLTLWAIAATGLAVRLAAAVHTLQRRRDGWPMAEVDGVRVRLSSDAGPAVVGVRPMDVVLPEWALSLDRPLRALVLRHEQEHRAAGDPYLLLLATALTVLVPWHAALWWQIRRLRLAIEVDCDARVLRVHPHRDRYALLLLAISQRRGAGTPHLAPAISEPTSHLDQRITAMHTPAHSTSRPRTLAFAIATVVAIAVACSVELPERPTAPAAPPVAAAPSAAPVRRSPPPGGFFEFQIEQPADKLSGQAPVYPAALKAAKVRGQVIAQFVVDTAGRAEMSTFKVLRSDHALFTAAVEQVLPEWRFTAAQTSGRKVRQLVQVPFQFAAKPQPGGAG